MNDDVTTPVGVTEASFDLLEWIESGTVARREVTIYNDPALVTEYKELQNRLDELGYDEDEEHSRPGANDTALGDGGEVEEILAKMTGLYERWQASKAVWTVRAISRDEMVAAYDEVPEPKQPIPPKENAARPLQEAFMEAVQKFTREKRDTDEDRKLVLLATAVVSIQTSLGTTDRVTVEQLQALRSRPHGTQWITLLYEAMEAATENDVEIPRPTSNGRSATSQG